MYSTHRRSEASLYPSYALIFPGLSKHIQHVFVDFLPAFLCQFALKLQTCFGYLGRI